MDTMEPLQELDDVCVKELANIGVTATKLQDVIQEVTKQDSLVAATIDSAIKQ